MPNHFHFLVYVYRLQFPTPAGKMRTLNDSIGIMLRSYTRAINNQEDRTGVLFRPKTKAKYDLIEDGFITMDGPKQKYFFETEHQYAKRCFRYIHLNAVKAKLVRRAIDWPYSSAREYASLRRKRFCNCELAKELGLTAGIGEGIDDSHQLGF
jgi:putative transposase